MKARGCYVYGVWSKEKGRWLVMGYDFKSCRESHEMRGVPKKSIRRVYIAPPKK